MTPPVTDQSADVAMAEPPAEPPAEPATGQDDAADEADPTESRWESANKTVRDTGKWLIATILSFSAIVLASGGFIAKGEYGEAYFWPRALVMTAAALAVAIGVICLIRPVAQTLAVPEPTLLTLPSTLDKQIRAGPPEDFFPDDGTGATTMAHFRRRYVVWERRAREHRAAVTAKQLALDNAKTLTPPNPARVNELEEELAELLQRSESVESVWAVFRETRDDLLSRARYEYANLSFTSGSGSMVAGGVLLVVGAAIYLQAASFKATEEPEASPGPRLATLEQHDSRAGRQLWETVGLAACETAPGQVPVLLESGDGSADSLWQVRTLPKDDDCGITQFPVSNQVATVVVPEDKITIEYEKSTDTSEPTGTTEAD